MPKRYLLALIIFAVVFFGGLILLINLITRDPSPDSEENPQTTSEVQKNLEKDARSVTFTTYGGVVGDEDRRAIKIIINETERRIEILQGYQGRVLQEQSTPNTKAAYDEFLIALKSAGFDSVDKNVKIDERTRCVTGIRYTYDIEYADSEDVHSWSNNCDRDEGSFKGNRRLVQTLMRDQIPNYSKITSGVRL